ncbi:DHA2 family efflux MFS transporter permease subunit [Dietzia sp.]|uniref:DHA2 family efflux MFS transporter permease subunit n=1 Tax=Dietzia sp. TaxID=1871616 RepID=UPI002FD8F7B0
MSSEYETAMSPAAGRPAAPAGRPDTKRDSGQAPGRRGWFGLATLSAGLGLIVLDGTIVGVALPQIIPEIGLTLTTAQWVNSLYAVLLAALLLSSGKLADRFGRRRLFLSGLGIFVVGSALAATADSAAPLLWARAIQAIGAAFIMPSTLSTVNAVFRGKYRAAAFGVWGAVISGAAAVGPLLGGALTQWASWHWIFLVNIPLGIAVAVSALFTVPETRGGEQRRGADVDGALLSAIGLGALVFAVVQGPSTGWWTPIREFSLGGFTWPADATIGPVPVAIAVAAVALCLFAVWEKHREHNRRSALLDTRLFAIRTFSWGNLTAGAVGVGEFALIFVLPLYLVNVLGLGLMASGLVIAGMAIGAFLSGAMARHLAAAVGAPATVVIGLSLELLGVAALIVIIGPDTPGWLVAAPLVVYGLGLGLASAQLTSTVLRDVPVAESGQASATQSTVRQVGTALGTAVAGAALSVALAAVLPASLESESVPAGDAEQLVAQTTESAGSNIPAQRDRAEAGVGHGGAEQEAIAEALGAGFADGTRWALGVAAVFLLAGLGGAGAVWRASRSAEERPAAGA